MTLLAGFTVLCGCLPLACGFCYWILVVCYGVYTAAAYYAVWDAAEESAGEDEFSYSG